MKLRQSLSNSKKALLILATKGGVKKNLVFEVGSDFDKKISFFFFELFYLKKLISLFTSRNNIGSWTDNLLKKKKKIFWDIKISLKGWNRFPQNSLSHYTKTLFLKEIVNIYPSFIGKF